MSLSENNLNDEWEAFMTSANDFEDDITEQTSKNDFDSTNAEMYVNTQNIHLFENIIPPEPTPIYISTKYKMKRQKN